MSITRVALLVLLFVFNTIMRDGAHKPVTFIPSDGVALLHKKFRLQCERLDFTPHREKMSYAWYRNSTLLDLHSSPVLLFPNVTEDDQGNYTCAVRKNKTGILLPQSSPVTLRAYSSNIPRPRIHPVDTAVFDQKFILVCDIADSYTPSGNVTFAWYKEGKQVVVQFTPVLYFSPVKEEDEGVYACAVKDRGDTSPPSEAFPLTPLVSPEVHIALKIPHNVIKGILGENLTLTCEVTRAFPGVPADGFSWSYLPSPQGSRRPLVGKTSTLTLGPLTKEHAGHYVCQARNLQHFRGLSLIGSNASVTVHITYLDNISLTSDLRVKEGDPATLTCIVNSQPVARLAWIVHGQEVRYVTDNMDHYVIPRAGCNDSTSFTCRASNPDLPGWEMSASTRLHVQPCNTGTPVDSPQEESPAWKTGVLAALGILVIILMVILMVLWRRCRLTRCLRCARKRLLCRDTADTRDLELRTRTPLLQEPREDFQTVYRRGQVYVIPPLPPQQSPLAGDQADLDILGEEEARVCVLQLLRDLLKEHVRFYDPSVFVFTQALPPHMHAVIYHSEYGVTIVKTEVFSKPNSSLTLKAGEGLRKAAEQLGEARRRVETELRGLLEPEAVTLLLALPNLENREDLSDSARELLDDQDIQLLCGREADVDTWSQLPFTWVERPACWKQPDGYQAFDTAVNRHLSACGAPATARERDKTRTTACWPLQSRQTSYTIQ